MPLPFSKRSRWKWESEMRKSAHCKWGEECWWEGKEVEPEVAEWEEWKVELKIGISGGGKDGNYKGAKLDFLTPESTHRFSLVTVNAHTSGLL